MESSDDSAAKAGAFYGGNGNINGFVGYFSLDFLASVSVKVRIGFLAQGIGNGGNRSLPAIQMSPQTTFWDEVEWYPYSHHPHRTSC